NDLDAFENAYKSDKELDDQEKADEEIINSWENTKFTKAKELMVYWDFLETGRMTNRFHLGQTRASEKLRGQLSNKLDIIKNKYKYDQLRAA
ncbi:MAG: hypothetical protein MJ156_03215, partial [Alphaproteobacteria bacterium]|nr:hypothetical protein [Alphaproteobacteria bacterium]